MSDERMAAMNDPMDELIQLVTSLRKTGFAEGVHRTHLDQGDKTEQCIFALFLALLSEPEPRAISEAAIEAGAKALRAWNADENDFTDAWWTDQARAVLTAADAARTGVK